MKKIIAISILILTFLITPPTTLAQNNGDQQAASRFAQNKQDVVLPKNEVVNKDYFAAGNNVFLEGRVNGDAYLAGGNIVIDGTVNGDLLAAGGNIDIRGTVTGNIRAAGGNINVTGSVGRNATLAGGGINLATNANVTGSLAAAGGNLAVSSPIGKEANLAGGQIILGSKVGSDVNAATGRLGLAPTALINGNLSYLSNNPVSIPKEASVSGKITQYIPQGKPAPTAAIQAAAGLLTFLTIADFILAAIIGIFLIVFLPVYFEKTAGIIIKRPWLSLGIGLFAVIIFPFVFVLLLMTVIGIPVAFVLAFVLAIFGYLAKIFVAFVLGQLVFRQFNRQTNLIWPLLIGLIIYFIFTLLPVLGWIIATVAGLMGLGAILIEEKNFYKELRAKQIV